MLGIGLLLAACSAEDMAQLEELAGELEQLAEEAAAGDVVPTVEARLGYTERYQGQLVYDYTATLTERFRGLYSGATVAENRGEWRGYLSCHDDSADDGYWEGDWSSPLRLGEATRNPDEGSLLVEDTGDALLVAYHPPFALPVETPPECVEEDGEVLEVFFPANYLAQAASPVPGRPTVLRVEEGEGYVVALVPKDELGSDPLDLTASYEVSGTDEGPFEIFLDVTIRLEPAG